MACEICGEKASWCECTDSERQLMSELEDAYCTINELLEALERMVEYVHGNYGAMSWNELEPLVKAAEASISKAQGEAR